MYVCIHWSFFYQLYQYQDNINCSKKKPSQLSHTHIHKEKPYVYIKLESKKKDMFQQRKKIQEQKSKWHEQINFT